MEEEFRAWRAARGEPAPPVRLVKVEDGTATLVFWRVCADGAEGPRAATVSLMPVEGASFMAEGMEDASSQVEEWLTEVNSFMAEKPKLQLAGALDALLSKAPRGLLQQRDFDDGTGEDEDCDGSDSELDLQDDEDMDITVVQDAEERKRQREEYTEDARWHAKANAQACGGSRQASQVLMREMRALLALQGSGPASSSGAGARGPDSKALEIEMVEDSLYHWTVKMHSDGFPEDCALRKELRQFGARHPSGESAVVMDVQFPSTYPMSPPFIRVVRPRFQMHTGHITIGGSVCMQLLTPSGWLPSVSLENVFVSIRSEMIEGGGQLDLENSGRDYSMGEAREAFNRVAQRYGWLTQ